MSLLLPPQNNFRILIHFCTIYTNLLGRIVLIKARIGFPYFFSHILYEREIQFSVLAHVYPFNVHNQGPNPPPPAKKV